MQLQFIVPVRPVPKGRPRFDRRSGRVYTSEKTRQYESLVGAYAIEARPGGWPWRDESTRFELGLIICYPTAVVADGDNVVKAVSDACNGILWHDDRQVRAGSYVVTESCPEGCPDGCVVVTVETWHDPLPFKGQPELPGGAQ